MPPPGSDARERQCGASQHTRMIVWSALILVLTIIGYATLLIGLLYIARCGTRQWHAYKGMIR